MGMLYAKDNKIYANEYLEIYIPKEYFNKDNKIATNKGVSIESFGVTWIRNFPSGKPGPLKLLNVPIITNFMIYESRDDTLNIKGTNTPVLALQYLKDSHIMHQTFPTGRDVANDFLDIILRGKLPKTLEYTNLINIWWKNLQFSGVSYLVPSKIFEMVLASIYRSPNNVKERYGEYLGKGNGNGYDYKTANVRDVVKSLSTFSGMIFEDINSMIINGINNSITGENENVSPLEKIIYY